MPFPKSGYMVNSLQLTLGVQKGLILGRAMAKFLSLLGALAMRASVSSAISLSSTATALLLFGGGSKVTRLLGLSLGGMDYLELYL